MTDIPLTPEDERVIARAARLHLYHTLCTPLEDRPPLVLPSMISDYVDGGNPQADGPIAAALRENLPLLRLYRHLRDIRSMAKEIEQVAAAGGESSGGQLVLDHATLYWREVIPHSSRVLLRLRFHGDISPAPDSRPVLHLEWGPESEIRVACIVFPELVDDATQSMLPVEDPRLQRLMADAGRAFPATRYRVVA